MFLSYAGTLLLLIFGTTLDTCRMEEWIKSPYPIWGFPGGSADKESSCSVGDLGLIPGLGISLGEGKGYPLQYSILENSIDYIVMGFQRVRQDWEIFTFTFHFQITWFLHIIKTKAFIFVSRKTLPYTNILLLFLDFYLARLICIKYYLGDKF